MKVCMTIPYFPPVFSGAGIQVEALCRCLLERGVEVHVLTLDLGGQAARELKDNLLIHRLPFSTSSEKHYVRTKGSQLLLMPRLARFLWSHRGDFDIVHIHGAFLPLFGPALLMARMLGKRVVITFWSPNDDVPHIIEKKFLGSLQLRVLSMVDRFVSVTSFVFSDCRRAGLPPAKLRRIPAGIDTDQRFKPVSAEEKARLRHGLSLDPKARIAVFTGGIIQRKGIDVLIEAWRLVVDQCPDALLLLVGPTDISEGPAQAGFVAGQQEKIAEYGLRDKVRFIGQVNDVERYLQLSDLFVFPSRRETFGISLIEGMACGLPCVISTIEGVSTDIVEDGVDGILVKPGDAGEFGQAVVRVLSDRSLARRLGDRARRKVNAHFTISGVGEQHITMYEELLVRC